MIIVFFLFFLTFHQAFNFTLIFFLIHHFSETIFSVSFRFINCNTFFLVYFLLWTNILQMWNHRFEVIFYVLCKIFFRNIWWIHWGKLKQKLINVRNVDALLFFLSRRLKLVKLRKDWCANFFDFLGASSVANEFVKPSKTFT